MRELAWSVWVGALVVAFGLAGCTMLGGIGGSSQYGCASPPGVKCDSVSGNYYNALQQNLPSQRSKGEVAPTAEEGAAPAGPTGKSVTRSGLQPVAASGARAAAPAAGGSYALPLRSQSRVLRMWFKPWEDADRDLYDQGYVYVQIDSGQWLTEHIERSTRDAYAPIRPPRTASSSSPQGGANAGTDARVAAREAQGSGAAVVQAVRSMQERAISRDGSDEDQ